MEVVFEYKEDGMRLFTLEDMDKISKKYDLVCDGDKRIIQACNREN